MSGNNKIPVLFTFSNIDNYPLKGKTNEDEKAQEQLNTL